MPERRYTQAELDRAVTAERQAVTDSCHDFLKRLMIAHFTRGGCEWLEIMDEHYSEFSQTERDEFLILRHQAWLEAIVRQIREEQAAVKPGANP